LAFCQLYNLIKSMVADLVNFARFLLLYGLSFAYSFIFLFILELKKETLHFVELVGEATRIPLAIKHITEVFG